MKVIHACPEIDSTPVPGETWEPSGLDSVTFLTGSLLMRYFQNLTGSLPVCYCKILPGALLKILVLRYYIQYKYIFTTYKYHFVYTSIILNLMHLCRNLVQEWIFKSSNKWILLLHELKKPKARFWGFGRFLEKKSTFCGFWVTSNVHFSDALLVHYFGWNDWCVTFPQNWVINYFFKHYFCVTVKPWEPFITSFDPKGSFRHQRQKNLLTPMGYSSL